MNPAVEERTAQEKGSFGFVDKGEGQMRSRLLLLKVGGWFVKKEVPVGNMG